MREHRGQSIRVGGEEEVCPVEKPWPQQERRGARSREKRRDARRVEGGCLFIQKCPSERDARESTSEAAINK